MVEKTSGVVGEWQGVHLPTKERFVLGARSEESAKAACVEISSLVADFSRRDPELFCGYGLSVLRGQISKIEHKYRIAK